MIKVIIIFMVIFLGETSKPNHLLTGSVQFQAVQPGCIFKKNRWSLHGPLLKLHVHTCTTVLWSICLPSSNSIHC